jgi:hypothetical protein
VRGQKKKTKFGVYAAGPSLSWQVLCLLAATMARGNRQEEVPVFSASGTVGMLSPCTALCTYFSTAFFFRFFFASFRNWGSGSGTGFFFNSIL